MGDRVNREVKAAARQRILSIAQGLYKTNGFKEVTMDRLAQEAEISKKTIYHFFGTKTVLVEAVIQGLIEEQTKALQEKRMYAANSV